MARLSDRVAKLEAAPRTSASGPFCASPRHQSANTINAIYEAVSTGYWDRLTAHPVVAAIYATREPTAEQWETVGAIARELVATEQPDPNDSGLKILEKV